MIWSMVAQGFWLLLDLLFVLRQSADEKDVEILLLRQQLRIVARKQKRAPRLERWEKLVLAMLMVRLKQATAAGRERWKAAILLFKPETVLKWHRDLVRRKWTFQSSHDRGGNAPLDPALEHLIVQLAQENPSLGYKKLVGELRRYTYRIGWIIGEVCRVL